MCNLADSPQQACQQHTTQSVIYLHFVIYVSDYTVILDSETFCIQLYNFQLEHVQHRGGWIRILSPNYECRGSGERGAKHEGGVDAENWGYQVNIIKK